VLLFDEIDRTDGSPARRTEDSFRFLNRAGGAVWDRIRSHLETWYAAFPDSDRDLRRRFRSRDPRQHYAAWWELYLHGVLTALDYELTVHPEIPGTKGHPDLLAERGDESFYVEGVTVFSGIVSLRPNGPLQAAVMDLIDTVDASQFMVGLQFARSGSSMPKRSDITGPIEAWLATLDADALLASAETGVLAAPTTIEFGEWAVALRPIPRSSRFRGCPDNRLIGIGPAVGGVTNDVQKLRAALTRKKGQFGTPDKPLLVAALPINGFIGDHVVESALFGSEAVRFNIETRATSLVRSPDGVWIGKRGPAAKRISAVLIGTGILPHSITTAWPEVWHHFAPTYALVADLPFSEVQVVNDHLEVNDALMSPADVLGLRADWPGPEPAFPRCLHRPEDHRPARPPSSPRV
jgi:hypothetical protein